MVSPVLLEDVSCPLGCMKNDEIVLTGFDLIHNLPGVFNIVRCCNCGLMRTNPRPTPKNISLIGEMLKSLLMHFQIGKEFRICVKNIRD